MTTKRSTLTTKRPKARKFSESDLNKHGAFALLNSTFNFLARNNVPYEAIANFAIALPQKGDRDLNNRLYQKLMRAYEDMGVVMATWYSDPKFLNDKGNPRPIPIKKGLHSIHHLIRAAGVRVQSSLAIDLLKRSPSVGVTINGDFVALRRVFVLPGFEVPRAALFVTRYLDTLQQNASGRKSATNLLLERSCHVSEVNLGTLLPVLRDIKTQGSAFMDSIDGEIEAKRNKGPKRNGSGELGVLVFAWTKPKTRSKHKAILRVKATYPSRELGN